MTNVYQIKVADYSNLLLGLYFYSTFWDQIVDYKTFRPDECGQMRFCQVEGMASEGHPGVLQFSLDDSRFSTLNFLPDDPTKPMHAKVYYRILNRAEQRFLYETLGVILVGVAIILVFGFILHRALSSSLHSELPDRGLDPQNRPIQQSLLDANAAGGEQVSGAYIDLAAASSSRELSADNRSAHLEAALFDSSRAHSAFHLGID